MRVAMVSEHASPLATLGGVDAGGQNVHVAGLACAMTDHDVEVLVHTRRDDRRLPRRVELRPGVTVDHVDAGPPHPVPKDELPPFMDAFADQLVEAWHDFRPDVVHAHFWMSGKAALAAARRVGIPVLQTFHALGTVKRRYQGSKDTSPPERIAWERRIARQVDGIVATSRDEVRELHRMGAPASRIAVVPCGVDLTLFRPDGPAEPRTPGRHRILVLGRLVERKGTDDVIAALPHVPHAELVVAGGPAAEALGRDPEAVRLQALAREVGVADRVRLRGRVERQDVPALIRSADVVVCVPWYEPFGIVPLEAMACGVPVVAAAVGGLLDTVVPGVTGLHVRARRPDELATALRTLLADPERRRQMGQAGLQRTRARYGWSRVAAGTLEAYAAVLAPAVAGGHAEVVG